MTRDQLTAVGKALYGHRQHLRAPKINANGRHDLHGNRTYQRGKVTR